MASQSLVRVAVAVVIIATILYFFNPIAYITPLLSAAPVIMALALMVVAGNMLLNAWAYHGLLKKHSKIGFIETVRTVFFAWAAESLLPGKLGSFSVAWLWKKKGVPLVNGLSIVLTYRVVIGLVTLAVAIIGIQVLFPSLAYSLATVAGLIALGIIVYLLLFSDYFVRIIGKFFPSIKEYSRSALIEMRSILLNPGKVFWLKLNALAQLGFASFVFMLMFQSTGTPVDFWAILVATAVVQMASLIPISINGLGIREGLFAVLLGMVGVPPALSIGVSAINTAVGYVITFLITTIWAGKWVRDAQKN